MIKRPNEVICPECEEPCEVIALDNSFDYSFGSINSIHKPASYGNPVSNCCEADIPEAKNWDWD